MAEELPPDDSDIPEADPMPRISAELAVAQALGAIGLNWAHFQEDHEQEAAVLLDAATMAEVHYSDDIPESARAVLEAWDAEEPTGSVSQEFVTALDQLRMAVDDEPVEQTDPSDSDLAEMADAEKGGGK